VLSTQLDRLNDLGLADVAGISESMLARYATALPEEPGATVAVHPSLVSARQLAPLLRRTQKPGFVVGDLTDLEDFGPIAGLEIPDDPLYLVYDIQRGDDMRNWSPKEALPAITGLGRTPLTLNEGISWLLQEPTMLERNHCFMTIGSRKPTTKGLDARTPAVWISGGTGHDGKENAGAPKVGWCWAGNRHTWLGFASARTRSASPGRHGADKPTPETPRER
jgi:hypothetical protein